MIISSTSVSVPNTMLCEPPFACVKDQAVRADAVYLCVAVIGYDARVPVRGDSQVRLKRLVVTQSPRARHGVALSNSALTRLQPRVAPVDHVNATPAADHHRTGAQLEGPDRASDLHGGLLSAHADNAGTASGIPAHDRRSNSEHIGLIIPTDLSLRGVGTLGARAMEFLTLADVVLYALEESGTKPSHPEPDRWKPARDADVNGRDEGSDPLFVFEAG